MSLAREILIKQKVAELKILCQNYSIPSSGAKKEIVQRILEAQEKKQQKTAAYKACMEKGAVRQDEEFEKTIACFQMWCRSHMFQVQTPSDDGFGFRPVHTNELRAAFIDYDYTASPLRADKLVPVPKLKFEEFLEMFYEKLDTEWYMNPVDENDDENEFDEATFNEWIRSTDAGNWNQEAVWTLA